MLKRFLIKHNIIKGSFYIEAFVYVDRKTGRACDVSDTIKWLQPFCIKCFDKGKDDIAFNMLHYKYPEYIGYINLY